MWRKSLIFDPGMLRARCYHKSSISKACAPSSERNRRGDPAGFFYVSKGQAFCQTFAPVIGSSTTSRCTSTRGIKSALRWLDGLRVMGGLWSARAVEAGRSSLQGSFQIWECGHLRSRARGFQHLGGSGQSDRKDGREDEECCFHDVENGFPPGNAPSEKEPGKKEETFLPGTLLLHRIPQPRSRKSPLAVQIPL